MLLLVASKPKFKEKLDEIEISVNMYTEHKIYSETKNNETNIQNIILVKIFLLFYSNSNKIRNEKRKSPGSKYFYKILSRYYDK